MLLEVHVYLFGRIVVGKFKCGKMGDHQRKKFFINNSVEVLIPFNKEHQVLLKLPVSLVWGWGVRVWGENGAISKSGNFLRKGKITCEEASRNLLEFCLSFGEGLEGSNEGNMVRPQKEEVLYENM